MGAIFALASGTRDMASAGVDAIVAGTHAAFATAAFLVIGALLLALGFSRQAQTASSTL